MEFVPKLSRCQKSPTQEFGLTLHIICPKGDQVILPINLVADYIESELLLKSYPFFDSQADECNLLLFAGTKNERNTADQR